MTYQKSLEHIDHDIMYAKQFNDYEFVRYSFYFWNTDEQLHAIKLVDSSLKHEWQNLLIDSEYLLKDFVTLLIEEGISLKALENYSMTEVRKYVKKQKQKLAIAIMNQNSNK